MKEIITITTATINNEEVNTVNARELWQKLGVKTQFKDWMPRRIDEYGFEEGRDFTVLKNERGRNANGKFCSKEYLISLDMAKELAMVENNEQGRKIRHYFIEVEKAYRKQLAASDPIARKLASEIHNKAVSQVQRDLDGLENVICQYLHKHNYSIDGEFWKTYRIGKKENLSLYNQKVQSLIKQIVDPKLIAKVMLSLEAAEAEK